MSSSTPAAAVSQGDVEVLSRHHQFVRDDEKDEALVRKDWKDRMARKYYDSLYKEYVIADLSRYKLGQIGLRWRVEAEVLAGLGNEICGALQCGENIGLTTFEVPFQYTEQNIQKSELVKLKLCSSCSKKLKKLRKIAKNQIAEYSESKKRKRDVS